MKYINRPRTQARIKDKGHGDSSGMGRLFPNDLTYMVWFCTEHGSFLTRHYLVSFFFFQFKSHIY